MDSVFPSQNAHWYRSPKGVRCMLTILLMSTLLTASLVVLAYRTSFTILLDLAKYAASICALLHFAIVAMLLGLIAGALTVWKKLQAERKYTEELKQLRQVIVSATAMTLLMLMLAVAAACIPFVMNVMREIPEFGVVFAIMLIALLIHRVNINRVCGRLANSMTAAQRSAKRTMAA
ncbi:hypothetical protein KWH04_20920 [Xanthomonas campestris pv. trichodesmae]|uniref:DUF2975 domain-containing protein n=2 Tax=Xanthomonas citri TaxID=346 RepID=A0AB33CJV1_XANCI|nr:hypothetical protein [Xanthomonas citri]ASK92295.1 hypothetical protein XcvCFBP7111P_12990 [Xanthomonas citri pv. vignicola]MBV6783037.1 hypothetical protein [Xanthomonas campestris pv. trichodesmae]MBZ3922542.1 hypothetical protein [Xanthomonas campestris pv. trichodesmae]MBZ3927028.1 hypothetical protein [Xanthomonas citri pv. sesbaniae]